MKRLSLILLTIPLLVASPLHAVSYPPSVQEPTYLKEEDVMTRGFKVHMFHSGTPDVTSAVKINDVLVVYREYPPDLWTVSKQTGKVKVISILGPYYFEGEVVEGFVQPGSLALKGNVACIITTRLKEKR
ncbi:hypothetical protein L4X63_21905 [Geomonas sp. Red32]|uniref:hypothetical protein n=1 Tax=Geomonas sp. Red32 TaxID=2912856 RepID=UPI00202CE0A8|nr:hypothetical protein [Geomonas sp. Red32]MCM0084242.1 hypothetical protein [Geomonas sp. Red32]